jgi:hypothetical protein
MNTKDFTIGVLSVTAVILLVGFLLLQAIPPQPVLASGESGAIGDYILNTAYVDAQCEVISILDTATQRLNFYQLDPLNNQLMLLTSMDVRNQPAAQPGRPGRRR